MRQVIKNQLTFGEINISEIKFDIRSRDDMPKILRGLQYIYVTEELRKPIFDLLESEIQPKISKSNGRPGMELWKVLVLGVIRLELNCDYDRLQELANNHRVLRQMLGHSDVFDETYYYKLQTLKDNVSLLGEDLLVKINTIIVTGGQVLAGKKLQGEALHGRCDSFVVETDVHYPTDVNLLLDAMRKVLFISGDLCDRYNLSDLRQYKHNYKQIKRVVHKAQKAKKGKSEQFKIVRAHEICIKLSQEQLVKVEALLEKLKCMVLDLTSIALSREISGYIVHAKRQIDQIRRRVIKGEVIPHEEKVFSIFEPYTEWISKGKAGVPVELGVRVCVLEDHYQFILHHRVMIKETDDKVALAMVEEAKKKFADLKVVSFDKGFHSKSNQDSLQGLLETVVLPSKGKLNKERKETENSLNFRKFRRKHSAIESAINALEVHGLDFCPDHGISGFKRYVAFAIVTRNIRRIGDILSKQVQRQQRIQIKRQIRSSNHKAYKLLA